MKTNHTMIIFKVTVEQRDNVRKMADDKTKEIGVKVSSAHILRELIDKAYNELSKEKKV